MQVPDINLVGFFVDGSRVDSVIADGPFASLFAALSEQGEKSAIKVAKLKDEEMSSRQQNIFYTRAFATGLGGPREVKPDCNELLIKQAESLKALQGTAFVTVTDYSETSPNAQYTMPYIEGRTLRDLLLTQGVAHESVMSICREMSLLEKKGNKGDIACGHHDLKPENIIIRADGGITFLDPGYFGQLRLAAGGPQEIAVTTPEYYPYLEPFDLLAFGYILWECLCGIHPLVPTLYAGPIITMGPLLSEKLARHELSGNHYFSPLRELWLPTYANSSLSKDAEHILLKGIGLKLVDEQTLEVSDYYQSFDELYKALETIVAPEIWETAYRPKSPTPERTYEIDRASLFGIQGLASIVNGRQDPRPFKFALMRVFSSMGLTEEDSLSCMAGKILDQISLVVLANEFTQEYRLAGIFDAGAKGIYLILKDTPELTDEDRVMTYFIARAEATNLLKTLNESELATVISQAGKILETGSAFETNLIERAFGQLSEPENI